eukprot:1818419-Prymnesium_polylepis.1
MRGATWLQPFDLIANCHILWEFGRLRGGHSCSEVCMRLLPLAGGRPLAVCRFAHTSAQPRSHVPRPSHAR